MTELSAHEVTTSGPPCDTPGCQGLAKSGRGPYAGLCEDCITGESAAQVLNRTLGRENPREETIRKMRSPKGPRVGRASVPRADQPEVPAGSLEAVVKKLVPKARAFEREALKKRSQSEKARQAFDEFKAGFEEIKVCVETLTRP